MLSPSHDRKRSDHRVTRNVLRSHMWWTTAIPARPKRIVTQALPAVDPLRTQPRGNAVRGLAHASLAVLHEERRGAKARH